MSNTMTGYSEKLYQQQLKRIMHVINSKIIEEMLMIKVFLISSLLKVNSITLILNYRLTKTFQKESKPTKFRFAIVFGIICHKERYLADGIRTILISFT